MYKYRAAISKGEEIRYISHLDYASLLQRAICRAKLPAAYSEGFNPHMKISFASALSVGVTAMEEYMEFELTAELDVKEIKARLEDQLPVGIKLLRIISCQTKLPALMSSADEAVYDIVLPPLPGDKYAAARSIDAFKRADKCVYQRITPKKKREIDIKRYVKHLAVAGNTDNELRLTMHIIISATGSIKPSEVLQALREQFQLMIKPASALIIRRMLLGKGQPLV